MPAKVARRRPVVRVEPVATLAALACAAVLFCAHDAQRTQRVSMGGRRGNPPFVRAGNPGAGNGR